MVECDIINNSLGRGEQRDMHGFIAEVAEVGAENAERLVQGLAEDAQWVNDNGPADLLRGGVEIRQKFVESGGRFSLGAAAMHMDKYLSFAAGGNVYQIPANHYETVKMLYEMPQEMAEKVLSCTGDGSSLRQWRQVHSFFDERGVGIDPLEPAWFEYKDVQASAIEGSLDREKEAIRDLDQKARADIYDANKPTLFEGAEAASVAAVAEVLASFALEAVKHKKAGKDIRDFIGEDQKEIAAPMGFGTFKGAVRG